MKARDYLDFHHSASFPIMARGIQYFLSFSSQNKMATELLTVPLNENFLYVNLSMQICRALKGYVTELYEVIGLRKLRVDLV